MAARLKKTLKIKFQFTSRPLVIQSQGARPAFMSQQILGMRQLIPVTHPAPLPDVMQMTHNSGWKRIPPKPKLKISRLKTGKITSNEACFNIDNYSSMTLLF